MSKKFYVEQMETAESIAEVNHYECKGCDWCMSHNPDVLWKGCERCVVERTANEMRSKLGKVEKIAQ